MDLMSLIQCFDACTKLGLTKSAKTLTKTIDVVSKQLYSSVKPKSLKVETISKTQPEVAENVQETETASN